MGRHRTSSAYALGVAALLLCLAAAPDTRPDEHVWDLGLVHGTTAEVARQVNGEVDRLTLRHGQLQTQITEEKANSDRLRAARLAIVRATPGYISIAASVQTTLTDLEAARKAHSSDAMEISGRLNHQRAALADMEKSALRADDRLQQSLKFNAGYADDLKKNDDALVAAQKWRAEVVSGIEGTFLLTWPLKDGEVGLLLDPRDVEVAGAGSRFLAYAAEWGKKISETESIKKAYVTGHPFIARIATGAPTTRSAYRVESIDDAVIPHVRLREVPDDDISKLIQAVEASK